MKKLVEKPLPIEPPLERTEQYILKRRSYLVDSGNRIAKRFSEGFSDSLTRKYGHSKSTYRVKFNKKSPSIEYILDQFFEEIDLFKIRHDMPTTELLNECKRAAAWVIVAKQSEMWQGLFVHEFSDGFNQQLKEDLPKMVVGQLVISLCYAELDVNENNVDQDTQKLLIHNVLKCLNDASFEWLVAMMHCLIKAFGRKKRKGEISDAGVSEC